MKKEIVADLDSLDLVCKEMDILVKKDIKIFLLIGDLASGKTTLTRAYAKYLGYKGEVSSPTFSLMNIYDNLIFHYDLYSKELVAFLSLGLLDELDREGVHLIEWGGELEKLLCSSGYSYAKISIEQKSDSRIYGVEYA